VNFNLLTPFSRLSSFLTHIHPLVYMAAYLLCIPAFGWAYTLVPHGFYAPYARYEPFAQQDADHLSQILKGAAARASGKGKPDHAVVGFTVQDILIEHLKAEEANRISFDLVFFVHRVGGVPMLMPVIYLAKISGDDAVPIRTDAGVLIYHEITLVEYRYGGLDPETNERFKANVFGAPKPSRDAPQYLLSLSEDEEEAFGAYLKGIEGDPTGLNGNLERMVYLSAVVITTLGLGDIVPLMRLTRFLVAFEAVLGVVLAGLFLNALAHRASRS
jgi:hypothetical protein